jgi:DNA-binding NtrC family response regulator
VIQLESQVGRGTSVHVYLPVFGACYIKEEKSVPEIQTGTGHILLVDDEPDICASVEEILQRLGYAVTARTDCLDALHLFESDPDLFDLVITDFTMPHMTGDRLAAKMLCIRSDIPIILCTGYSESMDRASAQRIGIREFALKPLTTSCLSDLVYRVLHSAASEQVLVNAGLARMHG